MHATSTYVQGFKLHLTGLHPSHQPARVQVPDKVPQRQTVQQALQHPQISTKSSIGTGHGADAGREGSEGESRQWRLL